MWVAGALVLVALIVLGYVYRKSAIVQSLEADFNSAQTWIETNGAAVEHKILADGEHVWTVIKGDLKGIGETLEKAVADIKSKL